MDTTEKNGQPSMEEILASIRRIIAEEPGSAPHAIDLKPNGIAVAADPSLDEHSDFELPSIFRTGAAPVSEKSPLFGRLTDAIRGTGAGAEAKALRDHDDSHDPNNGHARAEAPSQFGTLSSLKSAARTEPGHAEERRPDPVPETPAPPSAAKPAPAPASAGWKFGRSSTPPPPAVEAEVKRVMAPFKDTHFLQMTKSVQAPEQTAAPPPSPAAPLPQEPARRVDFGSIIPGHMDVPGAPGPDFPRRVDVPPPDPSARQHPLPERAMPPPIDHGLPQFPPNPPAFGAYDPPMGHNMPEEHLPPFRAASTLPAQDLGPTGTIEDTTAELLRPMLRQWLADNMPRMVEKALHIEVAESVRTGKKLTGQ